jgi:cytidylate kinase
MNKKHIITIAGKLGSGKSSTAKKVAEILGYEHKSTGDFMRQIADRRGVSLLELNKIAETDLSVDKELDDRNIEVGKMNNIVLDSRLGFYFISDSFKVFLELDPEIASERILKDKESNSNRNKETIEQFNTKESIADKIKQRLLSERKRYKDLYNIENHTDHSNFDLVIDTEKIPLEEVSKKVIEEYNNWLNK